MINWLDALEWINTPGCHTVGAAFGMIKIESLEDEAAKLNNAKTVRVYVPTLQNFAVTINGGEWVKPVSVRVQLDGEYARETA